MPHKVESRWGFRARGVNAAQRSAVIHRECLGEPRVPAQTDVIHRMQVIGDDLDFRGQRGLALPSVCWGAEGRRVEARAPRRGP
eukprot:8124513-Pyramimonas_sp.AAC.1